MTVEAALVFTLFLYCCGLFLTFFPGQLAALRLQKTLDGICSDVARYGYLLQFAEDLTGADILQLLEGGKLAGAVNGSGEAVAALLSEDTDLLEEVGSFLIGEGAALLWQQALTQLLVARTGREMLKRAPIRNGPEGLSLKGSRLKSRSLDLILSFTVESPLRFPLQLSYPVTLRSCRRLWTGTLSRRPEKAEEETEEAVVYITDTGRVYHVTTLCRVLDIRTSAVRAEEIPRLRNTSGAKYYPCESCLQGKKQKTGTVYITEDGHRYHSRPDCSKLKRTLQEIARSEAEDSYRPCSFCAGEAS